MNEETQQLERLYADIGPALLVYFRQFPGTASGAEDLVQDTFLRAYRCRQRLSEARSARAFVYGIARHVRLDALRRLRPVETLEQEPAAPVPTEDPRLELMREAIIQLPDPMRETLLLKLQLDFSYAEIAEALGIPLGTVRSRVHQAVLKLRHSLSSTQASP